MDTKKVQARQSDIFFRVVDGPSEGALKANKKHNSQVLANGEVTGHQHAICTPAISECETCVDPKGDIFIRSQEEIVVDHDEHGTVTLPADEWICISRQREYDALAAEKERQVAD